MDSNFIFSSNNIEVSEDVKGNLILDFILCDFSTNANGKKIKREGVEDKLSTMINMPLVGRLKTVNGETDFMGHNKKTKYEVINGEVINKTYLDTDALGVYTDCEIREIDNVEYICGKAILWNRFENAKKVIIDRFEKGDPIKSSWEMVITQSHNEIENGKTIEVIDDFYFIGNCLLGSKVSPAFKCAGVQELEVAEKEDDFEDELSSAIAQDINNFKEGGDKMDKDKEIVETEVSQENIEVSALTLGDIRRKVCKLAWELEKEEDYWLYDSIIYPLENIAYFKKEGANELEDDYLKVVYSVGEDNEVSIVSKENVKMTFVAKEKVVEVSELEGVKTELSEKVDSIVKLGETLAEKEALLSEKDKTIAELEVFKETVAEIEKEKAVAELEKKRRECSQAALSSGYISEADIEASEELKQAIAEADMSKVKVFIAEAVLKNVSKTEISEEKIENTKEIEVSTDLNSSSSYEYSGESGNPILDFIRKPGKRR